MSKVERHFLETEHETGIWVQAISLASALQENPVREGVKQEREGERCGLGESPPGPGAWWRVLEH